MYLYGNNAMQTANKVQSNIGSWLKSGKNAFVITALAAMQLFSACSTDPQVKKYDARIQAAKDLEAMNKEWNEYQAAKDTLDVKWKISDSDPRSIDKAQAAKEAAETAAREKKDFEDAKETYQSSKDKADEAAKEAK
jgi:hypothetical protein